MTSENQENICVVLVGKSGTGKSSSGNTILGEEVFKAESSPTAVTEHLEVKSCNKEDGTCITVVDTPGLFGTDMSPYFLEQELVRSCLVDPCPDVFVIVLRIDRFSTEDRDAISKLKNFYGDILKNRGILLLTRKDDLGKYQTVDTWIKKYSELDELGNLLGDRVVGFNNKSKDPGQVAEFLEAVQEVMNKDEPHYALAKLRAKYKGLDVAYKAENESYQCVELLIPPRVFTEAEQQYLEESFARLQKIHMGVVGAINMWMDTRSKIMEILKNMEDSWIMKKLTPNLASGVGGVGALAWSGFANCLVSEETVAGAYLCLTSTPVCAGAAAAFAGTTMVGTYLTKSYYRMHKYNTYKPQLQEVDVKVLRDVDIFHSSVLRQELNTVSARVDNISEEVNKKLKLYSKHAKLGKTIFVKLIRTLNFNPVWPMPKGESTVTSETENVSKIPTLPDTKNPACFDITSVMDPAGKAKDKDEFAECVNAAVTKLQRQWDTMKACQDYFNRRDEQCNKCNKDKNI